MKGIILAGGSGTRLYPLTKVLSKQLLPIYDKPMIYYPLSLLMIAEIKDILIITTPQDQKLFKDLLGDGSKFGINLSYEEQPSPNGLAQAFVIGEKFIGDDSCVMILGDNIFYGSGIKQKLLKAKEDAQKGLATIFAYHVHDPERFGIVDFDNNKNILSLEEKPINPKSNYAVTGIYFYDNSVLQKVKILKPSARGELEITDLNKLFLKERKLKLKLLGNGDCWFDTGTFESLLTATEFVRIVQRHQNITIASPEEIAYLNGWITKDSILQMTRLINNSYGKHLANILERDEI